MIMKKCPLCDGSFKKGMTTVTIDSGDSLVVLRNVPAMICSSCGEEYIEDNVMKAIEQKVSIQKEQKKEVEIYSYA
jgi:YgiT-type zinc finger domain-containing protein